jgi:hypothetical protein
MKQWRVTIAKRRELMVELLFVSRSRKRTWFRGWLSLNWEDELSRARPRHALGNGFSVDGV